MGLRVRVERGHARHGATWEASACRSGAPKLWLRSSAGFKEDAMPNAWERPTWGPGEGGTRASRRLRRRMAAPRASGRRVPELNGKARRRHWARALREYDAGRGCSSARGCDAWPKDDAGPGFNAGLGCRGCPDARCPDAPMPRGCGGHSFDDPAQRRQGT